MDEDTLTEGSESGEFGESEGELDSDNEITTDAQQELGEWLGQLQALSQELDSVRPGNMPIMVQNQMQNNAPSLPTLVKQRPPKPAVPPKPQLDSARFSQANLEESADVDLDALLNELCQLEDQLNNSTNVPDAMFQPTLMVSRPESQRPTPVLPLTDGASRLAGKAQPPDPTLPVQTTNLAIRTGSPDADSAFCDGVSMLSSESSTHRSRDSNVSSTDSSHGSLNTPSPTQQAELVHLRTVAEDKERPNSDPDESARLKAEKIKVALEKMKEASIKKLYVKVFTGDGASKSLLVDERSTVAYVLKQLAEKHRILPNADCSIIEHYPDLYMERIYEDHEYLVENILMWTRDSANKLVFVERPDKYRLFEEPQEYLVAESSAERRAKLDTGRKQQMIEEFFAPNRVQPPEIEGMLYLKADGKKAWKKHYFVLRASGLYYIPKGKSKSSKDLVCLMNLEMIQIYCGFGWKKKYKAPTDWGLALKHPQIQVKASKYIKYLCAEDEQTFDRWMVGLRIAKNGRQLYDNFEQLKNYLVSDEAKSATVSIKSSASAENCWNGFNGTNGQPNGDYCNDSIVVRPRSSGMGDSQVEVKVRPRSADINRGGQKRNSRSIVHVDLPTIPAEPESEYEATENGYYNYKPQIEQVENWSPRHQMAMITRNSRHSTTSSGTESMIAFENDSITGTIKRQPPETVRRVANHQRRQSAEGAASLSSSGKDSGGPEVDSDEEEFPPPPSPIDFSTPSVSNVPPEQNGHLCAPRPVSQQSFGKKKPPPPRRNEGTRLTTVPPPVAQKPKPSVPRMEAQPVMPNAGVDFNSELQRAMTRRLQKIEALEQTQR